MAYNCEKMRAKLNVLKFILVLYSRPLLDWAKVYQIQPIWGRRAGFRTPRHSPTELPTKNPRPQATSLGRWLVVSYLILPFLGKNHEYQTVTTLPTISTATTSEMGDRPDGQVARGDMIWRNSRSLLPSMLRIGVTTITTHYDTTRQFIDESLDNRS
jgi:hypothetical protein